MEGKRYFIFNLGGLHSPDLDVKLKGYFSQYGTVQDIFIRNQKGFGFVNIIAEEDLPVEHTLEGHTFKVDLARPKGTAPKDDSRYFVAGLAKLEEKFGQDVDNKLKEYFETNGGVVKEVFIRRGKGFAFVSATGLNQGFLKQGHVIADCQVKVDLAKPKEKQNAQQFGRRHYDEGMNRWDRGYRPPPSMFRRMPPMHRRRAALYESYEAAYHPDTFQAWKMREKYGAEYDEFAQRREEFQPRREEFQPRREEFQPRREAYQAQQYHRMQTDENPRERAYNRRGGFHPTGARENFRSPRKPTRYSAY